MASDLLAFVSARLRQKQLQHLAQRRKIAFYDSPPESIVDRRVTVDEDVPERDDARKLRYSISQGRLYPSHRGQRLTYDLELTLHRSP